MGQAHNQLPLVGRHAEWTTLLDIWIAASSGKASCVVLSGEAGIGKTRLVEELSVWVQRQGYGSASARCYAAEGALIYAPVADWLRAPALSKRLATLDPIWRREVARLLPELRNEQNGLAEAAPLTQGWQRMHLFEALARAILATNGPQLLWIDDLQWADRDTLEWLHFLLRFAARADAQHAPAQLMVACTVRSEEVTGDHPLTTLLTALRQEGHLHELTLGPLSPSESALLASHVAGNALTATAAAHLHQETEGNPLFLVEMLHAQQTSLPPLPPKLHAVIQARFDRLSRQAHELAGLAATIGRAFTLEVLARAWGQEEETLVTCLDELLQRGIVRERDTVREQSAGDERETEREPGIVRYDFTHGKLREVAYQSLSAARRKLLHRRVASALEAEHGQRLDEFSGQVATHYEMAGQVDQAVPYYQRAAEVARRIYANAEALQYCRRALALQKESGRAEPLQSERLYEQLGDLLHFTGHYAEARLAYTEAIRFLLPADPLESAHLHRKLGNSWREQYRYQEALQLYGEAKRLLEGARPDGDDLLLRTWGQEWVQLLQEMRLVYYWLGLVEEDEALTSLMQPEVEAFGTASQRADFYYMNNGIAFRRNRSRATAQIIANDRQALAVRLAAQEQEKIPAAYFMLGFHLLWGDEAEAASAPLRAALQMAEETGDVSLQARALTYLTITYRRCEEVDEAYESAQRAKAVATAVQMPEYIAAADANLAWVAWRRAEWSQVSAFGQAALDTWHTLPSGHASVHFQWTALWPLLALAADGDDLDVAIAHGAALLDPAQQSLPAALTSLLEQMVQASESAAPTLVRDLLAQAIALAKQLRYL